MSCATTMSQLMSRRVDVGCIGAQLDDEGMEAQRQRSEHERSLSSIEMRSVLALVAARLADPPAALTPAAAEAEAESSCADADGGGSSDSHGSGPAATAAFEHAPLPFLLPELQRMVADYAAPARLFVGVSPAEEGEERQGAVEGWRVERLQPDQLRCLLLQRRLDQLRTAEAAAAAGSDVVMIDQEAVEEQVDELQKRPLDQLLDECRGEQADTSQAAAAAPPPPALPPPLPPPPPPQQQQQHPQPPQLPPALQHLPHNVAFEFWQLDQHDPDALHAIGIAPQPHAHPLHAAAPHLPHGAMWDQDDHHVGHMEGVHFDGAVEAEDDQDLQEPAVAYHHMHMPPAAATAAAAVPAAVPPAAAAAAPAAVPLAGAAAAPVPAAVPAQTTPIYPDLPFKYLIEVTGADRIYCRHADAEVDKHMRRLRLEKAAERQRQLRVMQKASGQQPQPGASLSPLSRPVRDCHLLPYLRLLFIDAHQQAGLPQLPASVLSLVSAYASEPTRCSLPYVFSFVHAGSESPLRVEREDEFRSRLWPHISKYQPAHAAAMAERLFGPAADALSQTDHEGGGDADWSSNEVDREVAEERKQASTGAGTRAHSSHPLREREVRRQQCLHALWAEQCAHERRSSNFVNFLRSTVVPGAPAHFSWLLRGGAFDHVVQWQQVIKPPPQY